MIKTPRSIVIGTAGHIDHGKTTLIRALTGIDADRLPEEKRRGITIDLGFASIEAQAPDGSPLRISFVDVPGHSLFTRNMLAGAGCVQAAMLIIAADEGIMPQTVEHFAICELLGISQGLTVITKMDAVSASHLQNVLRTIETFVQGTFLDSKVAPILAVSAATGEGVETLRSELIRLASRAQLETSDALLRLPIDRSFVMKGFGTVVTGTLLSGEIRSGESLQLLPEGRAVRVRGLQTHGNYVQTVPPGSRVALNLSGIDAQEIRRGQLLVTPDTFSPVETVDVEVRLLQSAPSLKHRAEVHFHAFTSETMATISLYGYEAAQPGTFRLMRLKLVEPLVLSPGDRFVLRHPHPAGTIGGGRVLDAHPESRQKKATTLAWLEQLQKATTAQQLALCVGRRTLTGTTIPALSRETGLTELAIRNHLNMALGSGDLQLINADILLAREGLLDAVNAIATRLQPGRPQKTSELRSRTGLTSPVFDFAVNVLLREGKIDINDEKISLATRGSTSHEETERLAAIAQAYQKAGLASPSVGALGEAFALDSSEMHRIITTLIRNNTIVRMGSDDLLIHSYALQQLVAQLAPLRGTLIDIAAFKELTGLSRKYAIPLLEYLDRQRVTRKQGEQRLVL